MNLPPKGEASMPNMTEVLPLCTDLYSVYCSLLRRTIFFNGRIIYCLDIEGLAQRARLKIQVHFRHFSHP